MAMFIFCERRRRQPPTRAPYLRLRRKRRRVQVLTPIFEDESGAELRNGVTLLETGCGRQTTRWDDLISYMIIKSVIAPAEPCPCRPAGVLLDDFGEWGGIY